MVQLSLPSRREHYDDTFSGAFSDSDLRVAFHPNGTLKRVFYSLDEKVSAFATDAADLAAARTELAKAKLWDKLANLPTSDPRLDETKAKLAAEILNRMLEENKIAFETGHPMPFPHLHDGE